MPGYNVNMTALAPVRIVEPDRRMRFNVDEYYRMAEAGIIRPRDRVELIRGEVLNMSPIGRRHSGCVNRLVKHFKKVGDSAEMSVQNPLRLDARNEPQPDFMLLKPRTDVYSDGHPEPADVLLLVQAADATLNVELASSPRYFAEYGIAELWIVDIIGQSIHIFRHPRGDVYETKLIARAHETIAADAFPDHPVRVIDLTG